MNVFFLMQFGIRRAAALVSSPIHLFHIGMKEIDSYFVFVHICKFALLHDYTLFIFYAYLLLLIFLLWSYQFKKGDEMKWLVCIKLFVAIICML